jgi:hypothetical protein
MATMRVISREEAQQTQRTKEPGLRRVRMNQFDEYVKPLVDNPEEAVVFEDLGEEPSKFVLSLRGAFQRAGVSAIVRKMRNRDEVRAWVGEPTIRKRTPQAAAPPARRGRPKTAR